MSDTNYILYFENVRTKNRTLPARVGKKIIFFFLEVKKNNWVAGKIRVGR